MTTVDALDSKGAPARAPALRPRRLLGREREFAEIKESVLSWPVTTVIGPGGVGKTALATTVAATITRDAPTLLDTPVIRSIAEARGCTPAQVLLAWQLQQGVSVVPKSVNPARIAENFAAGEIELSKAELAQIAGLDRGYRLISGDIWIKPGAPWTFQTIWDEG